MFLLLVSVKCALVLYGDPSVPEENSQSNILSRKDVTVEDWVRLGIYKRNKHVFT